MLKAVVFVALFGCSLAIVCPPHICEEINCPVDVAFGCTNGLVVEKAGFCGCCAACVRELKEGEECGQEILVGVPDLYVCGKGLECNPRSLKCQKARDPCFREMAEKQKILDSHPGIKGVHMPTCNEDGTYTAKQCFESVCQCMYTDGTRLGYQVNIGKAAKMECKCAVMNHERATGLLGAGKDQCDELGNFEPRQCHEAECFCVDRNGEPIDPYEEIPVSEAYRTTCECARRNTDIIQLGMDCIPHKCDELGNFITPPKGAC